jgi:putative phosphoribosyl transferase
MQRLVSVKLSAGLLEGMLEVPDGARKVVLFAHGSGSSRFSSRNNYVAGELRRAGIGTLLMDLLTPDEEADYPVRFDIPLLTDRLGLACDLLRTEPATLSLPIGLFGASTGAAAALQLAALRLGDIAAVVSRGGRPDLAGADALAKVTAPTLLIVGGNDHEVITLNQQAFSALQCEKRIDIIPRATHLFEEPGTLEQVALLAQQWFGNRKH